MLVEASSVKTLLDGRRNKILLGKHKALLQLKDLKAVQQARRSGPTTAVKDPNRRPQRIRD
jgi:hypothetical protein